jgi:nucleotide-binding universal stress UspA family protein
MLALRTILQPTDFSERSESAFRLACALARDYGARLVILHVAAPQVTAYGDMVAPVPLAVTYRELKEKLLTLQGPNSQVHVEHRLEEGDPVGEILRVAGEIRCDLIVMGTHGRRGLSRLLMGSVAEQVVRRANCPVVTVKTPFPESIPAPDSATQEVVGV